MRIYQLPVAVANQIAAGEVIERPASVVKELLENCLDAQASQISIDIGHGGLNQIKISDNGLGIVEDDLPLAIAPHATSKIKKLDDLYSISSMGFRGEALASIASVSKLSIRSKPENQPHAMCLDMNGLDFTISPCARSQGTTVDVRDLFFNAPVRKKFLKSERIEFLAIELVVKRFALAAPAIAITLTHNGHQQFNLPAAQCAKTRLLRVRKLLGNRFIDEACHLEVSHAGMRLEGWISTQNYQRSQNDKQWIYINHRMVKDKLLNHAIKQAYEGWLDPGRHPSCLLYFTIQPSEVDINVHPTKHEVRFEQPRLVHDFFTSQINQVLQNQANLSEKYPSDDLQKASSYHYENVPTKAMVSEPWQPQPLQIMNLEQVNSQTKSWILFHKIYALIVLQEEPYLVNIKSLQADWLLAQLKQESFPLTQRPLLVPMTMTFSLEVFEKIKNAEAEFANLGITMKLCPDQRVSIQSLPVQIPHLDLKGFFSQLSGQFVWTPNTLLGLMVQSQSFDPKRLSSEEISALIDYFYKQLNGNKEKTIAYQHLSELVCERLMKETIIADCL